ncbi:MAG: ParB/RepB/Spo0J family partition protein [Oscillospiraceae bacterium]|nr:ParB/RepB/Spo0J family partition protein [Oscillospiraceae bacterium]
MNIPLLTREKVVGRIIDIPVARISSNPNQPRKCFDEDDIFCLAESIKSNGIIQPLTVREKNTDNIVSYEIVAGERRYRAAIVCGFDTVPCIVMDITESESAVMALVENIQRKDINCFEEAEAIRKMIDTYGLTQEEAARRLGKTQSTVANKLRLLKLTDREKRKIFEYKLTERHARAILKIDNAEIRENIIETIYRKGYNVEQTEKYVSSLLEKTRSEEKLKRRSSLFRHMSLFSNSINHAVEIMKAAGVECESRKIKGDGYVEFIVKIPTENMSE